MEVTQAQLEQMLASGEYSLTPQTPTPYTAEPVATATASEGIFPLTADTTVAQTPSYRLPKLKPMPAMSKSRQRKYDSKKNSFLTTAQKLSDPELAKQAYAAIEQKASLGSISATLQVLTAEDKRRKVERKRREKSIQVNAKTTRDRAKTKEKYAQGAAAYKTMGHLLGRLTENYSDDFVGWFDAPYNDMATVAPLPAEDGAGTYKQDFDAIFLLSKDANNMGANFTKGEQAMLRSTMPDMREKEDVYKRKLANYQRTMRDILSNKLESSRKAGYKIGELEDAVAMIDKGYQKSLDKFGLRGDKAFEEEGTQENSAKFTPYVPKTKAPPLTEAQNNEGDLVDNSTPHPVSREDTADGRVKVTFSDGSVKYAKKR